MNDTTTGFPGFAPGEDRNLLADVNQWRRTNGWAWGWIRGLVNAFPTRNATIAIDWQPASETPRGFTVSRRDASTGRWSEPDFYGADSIRQAVDLLAALGILPPVFSTAYRLGRSDGAFIANVETNPARRCRNCGATSGLRLLLVNPLELAYKTYECAAGCQQVTR